MLNWNFQNTYIKLPEKLFSVVLPTPVGTPETVVFNKELASALGLNSDEDSIKNVAKILSGNEIPSGAQPIAQAYAGHQFGGFTMLGDGRAILLGEHITPGGKRFDVQLKGSGTTPYSRRGDGRATLSALLREYLISEAMFHLNIPTTRSLAVISTGEEVYREQPYAGAVLTRIASSHIRVGTFEFVSNFLPNEILHQFTEYTVQRHYPELLKSDNIALVLLKKVLELQTELIVNWMRVGFIHGVMNTDNMSIAGETIDYGPCAFMNAYHPKTVFSSIDRQGRYAYDNQPSIALWNLSCLAGALLPLIDEDKKTAIAKAEEILDTFKPLFENKWREMMSRKLGIKDDQPGDLLLISELLNWMEANKADYTNTFRLLSQPEFVFDGIYEHETFKAWFKKWRERISAPDVLPAGILQNMQKANPAFIPRNHLVEKALSDATENNSMLAFNELNERLRDPFDYTKTDSIYQSPPDTDDRYYKTYCGT